MDYRTPCAHENLSRRASGPNIRLVKKSVLFYLFIFSKLTTSTQSKKIFLYVLHRLVMNIESKHAILQKTLQNDIVFPGSEKQKGFMKIC